MLHSSVPTKCDQNSTFIYEIGLYEKDTRHVEITYTAHHFPNLESIDERSESSSDAYKILEKRPGAFILTYKFIRNYTKGVDDSWTINGLNHKCVNDM